MVIDANNCDYKKLNEEVRAAGKRCTINNCLGQRFIGSGLSGMSVTINGVPGNALGAYLNGAKITVNGNAQDAVGDTMNAGKIIIHGNAGDAAGYAMRNGEIYIEGNAGYRAGIHMKAYKEKFPVMVIGKRCGSFLGEYQAGGLIIVLGLGCETRAVGNFIATGMHGGKIFLRGDYSDMTLPGQISIDLASKEDRAEIDRYVKEYCEHFNKSYSDIMSAPFYVITPNTKSPYKQMYVQN